MSGVNEIRSTFLDYFRSAGKNEGRFNNADYDQLLEEAKTAENPAGQYKAAEAILAEEVPAVFVYQYTNNDMLNPAIRGITFENVMDTWYAKDAYRVEQ